MKKLIVTADDFGAHDFIDAGIKEAVSAKCVNTISVITTFPDSKKRIEEYAEECRSKAPDVKFGIHLSFNAGSPVLKNEVSSLTKNGKFMGVNSYDYDKVDTFDVYKEAEAQIKLVIDAGVEPNHVSCHCGIMGLFPDFFKVYLLLAAKYELPIRNPILISREKIWGFRFSGMKREGLYRGIKIVESKGLDQALVNIASLTGDSITRKMKIFNGGNVTCPDYFIDTFYKNGSESRLKKILDKMPDNATSEMVVHLGQGHYDDSEKEQEKYNGINFKYFKGRIKELETITQKLNLHSAVEKDKNITMAHYPG
ncbi:MAG: ChbG/HpnK family deacetylase [Bacteroidales bacterium]|nr:ChbG/HpnK family deacetylase [Bacteroidales bacterium]